jgi:hypothetical protein
MKRIACLFLLSCIVSSHLLAVTSSTVNLPGGGDVAPSDSVNISLTGLVPSATYSIICYINANYPFEIVRFSSDFGSSSGTITSYMLNGDIVTQGQLNVGKNLAVIVGNFVNPSVSSVIFTNLDKNYTFNVNNCYATAVVG